MCSRSIDVYWLPRSLWCTSSSKLPADHPAAERVDHKGEEQVALPAAQIAEVCNSEPVEALGAEVTFDQVRPAMREGIWLCRAPGFPTPLGALDSSLAHQSLDAAPTDLLALALQGDPHTPVAVGAVVARVDLANTASRRSSLIARAERLPLERS